MGECLRRPRCLERLSLPLPLPPHPTTYGTPSGDHGEDVLRRNLLAPPLPHDYAWLRFRLLSPLRTADAVALYDRLRRRRRRRQHHKRECHRRGGAASAQEGLGVEA